jgi:hypothetical protein
MSFLSALADWALKAGGGAVPNVVSSAIVIKGKTLPLEDVKTALSAIPTALQLHAEGKSAGEIAKAITPLLLSVGEDVAGMLIPYGGTAVALAAWVIENARPMTFEEEQAWMARASQVGSG